MTKKEKEIHLDELERIHDTLLDLISDFKYLADIHYWGDGDYCGIKNKLDGALTQISLKIERERGM